MEYLYIEYTNAQGIFTRERFVLQKPGKKFRRIPVKFTTPKSPSKKTVYVNDTSSLPQAVKNFVEFKRGGTLTRWWVAS